MNRMYPTALNYILRSFFANGDAPNADITLWVCGVNASYTYDPLHVTVEDLGVNVSFEPVELTNTTILGSAVHADDFEFPSLDHLGELIAAAIVFATWNDGVDDISQLIGFADESEDSSIPQSIGGTRMSFRWLDEGIFGL